MAKKPQKKESSKKLPRVKPKGVQITQLPPVTDDLLAKLQQLHDQTSALIQAYGGEKEQGKAFAVEAIIDQLVRLLLLQVPKNLDGQVFFGNYTADSLARSCHLLNSALCELARRGDNNANKVLWQQSIYLTETFMELALKQPAKFRPIARNSLLMPSLRSLDLGFTSDATHISQAIELSKDCQTQSLKDNRVRLGSLCARLVAEYVEEIHRARRLWRRFFEAYDQPVPWPNEAAIEPLIGKSSNEIIEGWQKDRNAVQEAETLPRRLETFCLAEGGGSDRLRFLLLPELTKDTALLWWRHSIEPMVETRFQGLVGTALWAELGNATDNGSTNARLNHLKKYCPGKVKDSAGGSE